MADTPKRRIFACSSVSLDYFLFLVDSLRGAAVEVNPVAAVTESRYREAARSTVLRRILLRLEMYVLYPLKLLVATLKACHGDVFVVTSNTFFAPALVAALVWRRGIRVVHLLYDLVPDAIEVAGRMRSDGLRSKILGRIARANQSWTNGTVYLGPFLQKYAERRWGKSRQPAVIPIATDIRLYETPLPAPACRPLRVHYGGQLGLMHEADSLAATIQGLAAQGSLGTNIVFDARISGSRAASFEAAVRGLQGVSIGPTLPSDAWRSHAAGFHVGIVTLSPGGATVCLPSKSYAMMAAGLAILAICPRWSDLARLVEDTGAGWVIDNAACPTPWEESDIVAACRMSLPSDEVARSCRDALQAIASDHDRVVTCRRNAWKAIRETFSPETIREMWTHYLDQEVRSAR